MSDGKTDTEQPEGMRAYMRDGWELGGQALALVRGQPGLRRYFAATAVLILLTELGIAEAVITARHEGDVPERILVLLLTAYVIAVLSTAAGVGLAGLADRILSGEEPEAKYGFRLAFRRLPQVAAWSVFVVVIGIPARLITAWGVDQVATILLGFSVAVVVFFAVPAIALRGDGPIRAAQRSIGMVRRFWAGQAAGMVYVWLRPAIFIGLPGALALVGGFVLDREGYDYLGWTVGAGGAVAIAIAYFMFVCARSILSVALFHVAESGQTLEQFDTDRLNRLMRGPTSLIQRITQRFDGERLRRLRDWVQRQALRGEEVLLGERERREDRSGE